MVHLELVAVIRSADALQILPAIWIPSTGLSFALLPQPASFHPFQQFLSRPGCGYREIYRDLQESIENFGCDYAGAHGFAS